MSTSPSRCPQPPKHHSVFSGTAGSSSFGHYHMVWHPPRAGIFTKILHPVRVSDCSAEIVGISAGCLSGRYTGDRSFSWRGYPSDCSLDTTSVLSGLQREHRQVGAPAHARDRISRFPRLLSQPVSSLDDEERRQDQLNVQKPVESGNTNAAQFSQLHRQSYGIVARCSSSSTLYKGLTSTAGSSSPSEANMEHTSTTHSGGPGRPRVVVQPAQQIQRTATPKGGSSLTDQVRRSDGGRRRRLGSHLRCPHNGRPLVPSRADMAHQCSRASSSSICGTDICKESHGHSSSTARQPGRCIIGSAEALPILCVRYFR